MGLILAQLAVAHGAGSVSVVDLNRARLARASAMGADAIDLFRRGEGLKIEVVPAA